MCPSTWAFARVFFAAWSMLVCVMDSAAQEATAAPVPLHQARNRWAKNWPFSFRLQWDVVQAGDLPHGFSNARGSTLIRLERAARQSYGMRGPRSEPFGMTAGSTIRMTGLLTRWQ